ncbi:unnamed protein product [Pedinophyceae sp. YPF-701]|nr:unnamed protein product [Pedinophyceae sp. YPF-701]
MAYITNRAADVGSTTAALKAATKTLTASTTPGGMLVLEEGREVLELLHRVANGGTSGRRVAADDDTDAFHAMARAKVAALLRATSTLPDYQNARDFEDFDLVLEEPSFRLYSARCVHTAGLLSLKEYPKRQVAQLAPWILHEIINNQAAQQCSQKVQGIFGLFETPRSVMMVLQHIGLGSVSECLTARGCFLDEGFVAQCIITPLLQALDFMHRQDIAHMNVTPSSVFLKPSGNAVIGGFSCSMELSFKPPLNPTACVQYSPPEVVRMQVQQINNIESASGGKNSSMIGRLLGGKSGRRSAHNGASMRGIKQHLDALSHKVDIWQIGCLAYECITGILPFFMPDAEGRDITNGIMRFRTSDLEFPDDISEEFQDFIRQCLQPSPEDRPEADDLLAHPWLQVGPLVDEESQLVELSQVLIALTGAGEAGRDSEASESEDGAPLASPAKKRFGGSKDAGGPAGAFSNTVKKSQGYGNQDLGVQRRRMTMEVQRASERATGSGAPLQSRSSVQQDRNTDHGSTRRSNHEAVPSPAARRVKGSDNPDAEGGLLTRMSIADVQAAQLRSAARSMGLKMHKKAGAAEELVKSVAGSRPSGAYPRSRNHDGPGPSRMAQSSNVELKSADADQALLPGGATSGGGPQPSAEQQGKPADAKPGKLFRCCKGGAAQAAEPGALQAPPTVMRRDEHAQRVSLDRRRSLEARRAARNSLEVGKRATKLRSGASQRNQLVVRSSVERPRPGYAPPRSSQATRTINTAEEGIGAGVDTFVDNTLNQQIHNMRAALAATASERNMEARKVGEAAGSLPPEIAKADALRVVQSSARDLSKNLFKKPSKQRIELGESAQAATGVPMMVRTRSMQKDGTSAHAPDGLALSAIREDEGGLQSRDGARAPSSRGSKPSTPSGAGIASAFAGSGMRDSATPGVVPEASEGDVGRSMVGSIIERRSREVKRDSNNSASAHAHNPPHLDTLAQNA